MRRLARSGLRQRALYEVPSSVYGIGAAFDDEITRRDENGRTWLCAATDGVSGFRWVEVYAPRVDHDRTVNPEAIERFVEREAGRYPIETRLDDLANASPLVIRPYLADAA